MYALRDERALLRNKIGEARDVIIWHALQRGDDRCWIDDYLVHNKILHVPEPISLPAYDECMRLCEQYYRERSDVLVPELTDRSHLNHLDLGLMSGEKLRQEWRKIVAATATHYRVGIGRRTRDDDRRLYAVMPNLLSYVDMRLPPEAEFLPNCGRFVALKIEHPPQCALDLHHW